MIRRFDELNVRGTTKGALRRLGVFEPTPVQAEALPVLLSGRDAVVQAPTGSGKTLAYVIPAAELVDTGEQALQVLVLVPTRELAAQVGEVMDAVAGPRRARSLVLAGGRDVAGQLEALRQRVHIAVGTPGRVRDLLDRHALRLDALALLVLDEADRMLDLGFGEDVLAIAERAKADRQGALFSATIGDPVFLAAKACLRDPVRITIDAPPPEEAAIEHVAYDVADKIDALVALLEGRGEGSAIVFGRTRHGVARLARQLGRLGHEVALLKGKSAQQERDDAMESFRGGKTRVLLATNLAARGIDVAHVDLVVNYELPESADLLVHRIGRTGRMGRPGRAVTLLGPADAEAWERIAAHLAYPVERRAWTTPPAPRKTPKGGWRVPCASCGAEAHVPFEPDGVRPVYCPACFAAR